MILLLACSSPEPPSRPEPPPLEPAVEAPPSPPAEILELEEQLIQHLREAEPERIDSLVEPTGRPWLGCLDRSEGEDCQQDLPGPGWRASVKAGELELAAQPTNIEDWPSWLASWEGRLPTTSRNAHAALFVEGTLYELKVGCMEKERFEGELERFRAGLPHHPSLVVSPCGQVHLPVEQRDPVGSQGSSPG